MEDQDGMMDEGMDEGADGGVGAESVDYSGEIPTRHTEYRIPDITLPPELGGHSLNKEDFTKTMHELGITQKQAQGIWKKYTDSIMSNYEAIRAENKQVVEKEALGQVQKTLEGGDGLHLTPEEAQVLIDKIVTDMKHPYWNERSSPLERDKAVALVERLYEIRNGMETSVEGYLTKMHTERREQIKSMSSINLPGEKEVKSSSGERTSDNIHSTYKPIGDGQKETKSGYGQRIEDAFK